MRIMSITVTTVMAMAVAIIVAVTCARLGEFGFGIIRAREFFGTPESPEIGPPRVEGGHECGDDGDPVDQVVDPADMKTVHGPGPARRGLQCQQDLVLTEEA